MAAGDLVEVYNDDGSTQAMVYPTPTAKKGHTFMLFAYPTGVQGNVVNAGTNELILPNYKQTWANIRKLAAAPEGREAPELQGAGVQGGLILLPARRTATLALPGGRCS